MLCISASIREHNNNANLAILFLCHAIHTLIHLPNPHLTQLVRQTIRIRIHTILPLRCPPPTQTTHAITRGHPIRPRNRTSQSTIINIPLLIRLVLRIILIRRPRSGRWKRFLTFPLVPLECLAHCIYPFTFLLDNGWEWESRSLYFDIISFT